jgi:uncharacterized LabA/DUF88 family protein
MPTAILVDGDFFLKRHRRIYGNKEPAEVARELHRMCRSHLDQKDGPREMYRIFFYDCPPITKKVHHPITRQALDFSQTPVAAFRHQFHQELRKQRKVALRLGYLNERSGYWAIQPQRVKDLLGGRISVSDLDEQDVFYEVRQKGVDMRIGLDIASMAYKRQVDQIVLVAGDSDFVPAAKLARREGIDFILDPMWHPIRADLHEHIDGLRSVCPKPTAR